MAEQEGMTRTALFAKSKQKPKPVQYSHSYAEIVTLSTRAMFAEKRLIERTLTMESLKYL
ncbi:hypothetical protein [Ancylobacter rudongensis]|uniref:Uncharacterized protein n=1 Tax=Ancylobacter rudongensis TaxID=177413 RepID=A0A1G4UT01_9HYPH|nr:hypothetical protein [Ancylobacter rudongensis]SCW95929.1 hypothetical protein SAMN05660859_0150 [Ancylobacter rudongensis]